MYERFTDRARKVMMFANQEAKRLNHEYIGTEHILLGLIKEGAGIAANVLKNADVKLDRILGEVEKVVLKGPDRESPITLGRLPHTPKTKAVIEYSIEEARNLSHDYVGTEHLLLGLLRVDATASVILGSLGLNLESMREEIILFTKKPKSAPDFRAILERLVNARNEYASALDAAQVALKGAAS